MRHSTCLSILLLVSAQQVAASSSHRLAMAPSAPPPGACQPFKVTSPEDYSLLGAGGYSGRSLDRQIDQSGHEATQIDVVVNSGAKPVVLMLGAYEPTIWNISWTRNSYIAAIVLSGYHHQVAAGVPKDVPVMTATYDNKNPCGYFYSSSEGNEKINPLARRLFGRPVALFYPVKDGRVTIGDPVADMTGLLTARDNPPEQHFDQTAPLAGMAGLEDGLKRGLLRRATQQDADEWFAADAAATPARDEPPVAGGKEPKSPRISPHEAYVVLGPFRYPAGLYGGNSATFFVPKGVPAPSGNPGHSAVYDFNALEARSKSVRASQAAKRSTLRADDFKRLSAADIETRLESEHPSAYYFYAHELFQSNRKDDAVFWFYVGQLRYRFHLLANPNLPSDQDSAAFASLSATIGAQINSYAGGRPREWVRQIDRALKWDAQHENKFTSVSEHAAAHKQTRVGAEKLRAHIVENAEIIEKERRKNGLEYEHASCMTRSSALHLALLIRVAP